MAEWLVLGTAVPPFVNDSIAIVLGCNNPIVSCLEGKLRKSDQCLAIVSTGWINLIRQSQKKKNELVDQHLYT